MHCSLRGVLQKTADKFTSVSASPGPGLYSPLPSPHSKWVAAFPSRHSFEAASAMTPKPSQLSRGSFQPASLAQGLRHLPPSPLRAGQVATCQQVLRGPGKAWCPHLCSRSFSRTIPEAEFLTISFSSSICEIRHQRANGGSGSPIISLPLPLREPHTLPLGSKQPTASRNLLKSITDLWSHHHKGAFCSAEMD